MSERLGSDRQVSALAWILVALSVVLAAPLAGVLKIAAWRIAKRGAVESS